MHNVQKTVSNRARVDGTLVYKCINYLRIADIYATLGLAIFLKKNVDLFFALFIINLNELTISSLNFSWVF